MFIRIFSLCTCFLCWSISSMHHILSHLSVPKNFCIWWCTIIESGFIILSMHTLITATWTPVYVAYLLQIKTLDFMMLNTWWASLQVSSSFTLKMPSTSFSKVLLNLIQVVLHNLSISIQTHLQSEYSTDGFPWWLIETCHAGVLFIYQQPSSKCLICEHVDGIKYNDRLLASIGGIWLHELWASVARFLVQEKIC